MANEVVKYHNDLNTVNMRDWTPEEMNFLMAILTKLKNKGTTELIISKDELVELTMYAQRNNRKIEDVMKRLGERITTLKYRESNDRGFRIMVLFYTFTMEWNEKKTDFKLRVRVHNEFEYILNYFDINFNFTTFRLSEYVSLKSSYSKQMYRLLKQWRKIGKKEWPVDELKYLLSIPECYKASHIDTRVIKPIERELSRYFKNLKIKPIKKKTKGNPIIAYEFRWTPEKTNTWIEGQPQPDPNKKKKPKALPDWYGDTAPEEADPQLLEELQTLQKQHQN